MERKNFLKILKKYLSNRFKEKRFGFYNPSTLMNSDIEILKIINFQLEAHKRNTFTASIAMRPICCKNEYLKLEPGHRLGFFTENSRDTWWSCNSDEDLCESLDIVYDILEQKVFTLFDSINSINAFLELYDSGKYKKIIRWASDNHEYYEIGLMFLRIQNNKKAKEFFEKCLNELKDAYEAPYVIEQRKNCSIIIGLIDEDNQNELDSILKKNIENSRDFYKIK